MSPSRVYPRALLPVALAGLSVALALILGLGGPWLGEAGGQRTGPGWFRREQERTERLERLRAVLLARIAAKQALVDELIAGRCTLAEAVARCQEWNRNDPYFPWERFHAAARGRTEEERYRAHFLDAVAEVLAHTPQRKEAVLRRLKAEGRQPAGSTGR